MQPRKSNQRRIGRGTRSCLRFELGVTEGLLRGAMDGDEWSNQIVLLGLEVGANLWNGIEGDICGLDLRVGNVQTNCQPMSQGASN